MKYEPHMLIVMREPHVSTTAKECVVDSRLFNTFEGAHYEMMENLRRTIRNKKDEDAWFSVYHDDWAETDRFGFDKTEAWSDTNINYKYCWKIVEI
jgi:hypothetical protein